jgi:hypothetical protein
MFPLAILLTLGDIQEGHGRKRQNCTENNMKTPNAGRKAKTLDQLMRILFLGNYLFYRRSDFEHLQLFFSISQSHHFRSTNSINRFFRKTL